MKRYAFHHEERYDRCDPNGDRLSGSAGEPALDRYFRWLIEREIAAPRLSCSDSLHRLGPMAGARAGVFAREEVHLHNDVVTSNGDGSMENERLAPSLVAPSHEQLFD